MKSLQAKAEKELEHKLKIFKSNCNRVRALISFHKVHTLNEALKELGIPLDILPPLNKELDSTIQPSSFNEVISIIEPILISHWQKFIVDKTPSTEFGHQNIKEENEFLPSPLYNETDSLLESTLYNGYKSIKDSLLERRAWLEKFVPEISPKQKAKCLYFQYNCALEIFYALTQQDKKGVLLRANTGDGKTYAAGQIIRWLYDSEFLEGKSITPWKVLYVTGASIVEQTKDVLEKEFGLDLIEDICIANYESLRSSFGLEKFLDRKIIVEFGEEHEVWEWKKLLHPILVIWDECHKLKNEGSLQSLIAQACNNIDYIFPLTQKPAHIYQIFMSASPFSRVYHAKAFCCACKKEYATALGGVTRVTNANWHSQSKLIASPADPNEYSRSAIKRLLREYKDYIFPFRNVRRKHKGILEVVYIDFENSQDKEKYREAWNTFLDRKAKFEGKDYANSRFLVLVELGVFRQAAELIRAFFLARTMYQDWQKGFAPVAACCFKPTIAKIVLHLINDFNIPRDKISIIWGGYDAASGQKFTSEQITDTITRAMQDPDSVSLKTIKAIHKQLQADAEGLGNIPSEYRMGHQSRDARELERKRFQSGKSQFCLFTFGAGKEGLSLHQAEDYLRPRSQKNTPTYNEMEMLQAEGRTARITSKSDTVITTYVYKDTIEVPVLRRVLAKRTCLNLVTAHGEKYNQYDAELEKIMELAGLQKGEDEDEELEEQVFEQLENEKDESEE